MDELTPSLPAYDFYRCIGASGCRRIITKPEMTVGFETGVPCRCGGLKFSPINLPWYGWFIPRILKFAIWRFRGMA